MRFAALVALYVLALAIACGGTVTNGTGTGTGTTGSANPEPQPPKVCQHAKLSQANLVADARTRAMVGDRRKVGVIPVRLEVTKDCEVTLEVLDECNHQSYYGYQPYSGSHKTIVRDQNDLAAELPVGSSEVAHKLSGSRILRSDEVFVGVFEAAGGVKKADLKGKRCSEATHYIRKIYVGGFAMANAPEVELENIGSLLDDGGRSVFAQEGQPSACRDPGARGVGAGAVDLCSVPLKVELGTFAAGGKDPNECAHDPCEPGDALVKTCNTCVEAVCDQVAYCCKSDAQWDAACITKAKQLCSNPCTSCAHKLCESGVKLDATCHECVQKVCAEDSFCCNNSWDGGCVNKVVQKCELGKEQLDAHGCNALPPPPPPPPPPPTPSCNHDKCDVGDPMMTSCDSCTQKVCQADAYCCSTKWDVTCINKVNQLCPPTKCLTCDQIGSKGRCQGKVLRYCSAGTILTTDCSQLPTTPFCGYNSASSQYECTATPTTGGGCKKKNQACSGSGQCCSPLKCQGGVCQQPQ
jgi:hypothetical protein